MIRLPTTEIFLTPGGRHFLENVQEDLKDQRSLIILLPSGFEPEPLGDTLCFNMEQQGFAFTRIWLPDLSLEHGPPAALGKALGITWSHSQPVRTVETILQSQDLPEIIYLDGLDSLPQEHSVAWIAFIQQWAQACQGRAETAESDLPVLCLIAQAIHILPYDLTTNVFLSIRYWWGIPSALELRLLCRMESDGGQNTSVSRWREHVLPALAGSDTKLVEYLWDRVDTTNEALIDLLLLYAQDRGWNQAALKEWGSYEELNIAGIDGNEVPDKMYELWAHGVLSHTPEYGLELHSAALAVMGQHEDLLHRLWRGQAPFLLPLIDSVRLALCDHLTQRYGARWPVRWLEPEHETERQAVTNTPLACEWGHIERLLHTCSSLQQERRWLPLVSQTRRVRNLLAHYRPIDLTSFRKVCQEISRSRKKGLSLNTHI